MEITYIWNCTFSLQTVLRFVSHNSKSKASFVIFILDLNTKVWHTRARYIWHSYEPIHCLFWLIKLELSLNGVLLFWNKGEKRFSLTPGRPTGMNMIMNLMRQSMSENISCERSYFFYVGYNVGLIECTTLNTFCQLLKDSEMMNYLSD